jgi:PA14 domain
MLKFKSIIVMVIALITVSLFSVMPAFASGMTVDPKAGSIDTTYDVQANGFNVNETVSTWVQLSNGTTIALGQLKADNSGSVEFSVTPARSWKAGEVIAVAHGLSSKHEYSAKFTIVPSGDNSSNTTVTSGTVITNGSDSKSLTFYGSGYLPGERVAAWFQYPNELGTGTAHALSDITADASGNVSFGFTVGSDWMFGGYDIAAQGAQSKHTTYNTFSYFGTVSDQRAYWTVSSTISSLVWQGQYWNNTSLSGDPVLVLQDNAINFQWGTGSPGANVPADNFSARWDALSNVSTAQNYDITATADDGIRVWVDNNLVIDQWAEHSPTTYTATVYLGQGQHSFRVEYFEAGGDATAIVNIAPQ